MDEKILCPNCGKVVPPGKAYCMSCGITLGVKCPECGAVSPVSSTVCTGCGYKFAVYTGKKKQKKSAVISGFLKKRASIIMPVITSALIVTLAVFLFLTPFTFSSENNPMLESTVRITAWDALSSFFGNETTDTKAIFSFAGSMTNDYFPLRLMNDFIGLALPVQLIALLLGVLLLICNITKYGKATSRRLLVLSGIITVASLVQFTAVLISGIYLRGLMDSSVKMSVFSSAVGGTYIASLAISASFLLINLLYYILYFRKTEESGDERGYHSIFAENKLMKLIRNVGIKRRDKKGTKLKGEPTLTLTHRFTWYIVILIASLIFTQALMNVASYVFFLFVLIFPFVMLLYLLTAKSALTVYMVSDAATVEKYQPYTYEFKINNHFIFAYPFIDAMISVPQYNSVRCTERTVRMSIIPMSQYLMKNTVKFRFRGTYSIGVRCFYVYDLLQIFRIRVDIENMTDIYVLPRKLRTDESQALSVADSTARTVKSPITYDKLEVSDIREYRMGDALKSIHWKLSSKSEDFIVREYNTGTSNMTFVYCDLSARFPDEVPSAARVKDKKKKKSKATGSTAQVSASVKAASIDCNDPEVHSVSEDEINARMKQQAARASAIDRKNKKTKSHTGTADVTVVPTEEVDIHELADNSYYEDMNEYIADGIVELTVSSVLSELRTGRPVTLFWFDSRSASGAYAYTLSSVEDFNIVYKLFATAPLAPATDTVAKLCDMATETENSKQIFITGAIDKASVGDLCNIPGMGEGSSFGSAEVILYNPDVRFAHKKERARYIETCRAQLSANGLSLTEGHLPPAPENEPLNTEVSGNTAKEVPVNG